MSDPIVPVVRPWFQDGFHRFLRPFLRRHFHSIAVERDCLMPLDMEATPPLILYGNHPSWWDPLIAHFLNRVVFPRRQFYAPIDAVALEQHGVFKKLGFYGVRLNTTEGAEKREGPKTLTGPRAFLTRSVAIATAGRTAIWITPEGRFTDVRDHAAPLMPGLPHLCRRLSDGWVVPVGVEYVFWDERLPNCLVRFGQPIAIADHPRLSKPRWRALLETQLRENQSALAENVIARRDEPFENLLSGRRGAGRFYDAMRRCKAWAQGRDFQAAHGDHFK